VNVAAGARRSGGDGGGAADSSRLRVRHAGHGNLSAAFAELISHATRLEAMDRVLEALPPPSPDGLGRLERELAAPLAPPRVRARSKKTAAA
jgi:hypothetical protein